MRWLRAVALAVVVLVTGTPRAEALDLDLQSFAANGFGDTDLRGISATAGFFFPIRADQAGMGPTTIDLEFSHSPLLIADLSTITVAAGGRSLASAFLTPENRDRGRLAVAVPGELVVSPGLFVEVRTFMRLTRDDCEDPDNAALWTTVHGRSRIDLQLSPVPATLADLESLLTGPQAGAGDAPVPIGLPAEPNAEDLGVAAAAAFQIGRWHQEAQTDPRLVVERGVPGLGRPALDVSRSASVAGIRLAPGQGGISIEETTEGRPVVRLSGADGAGRRRAAEALGTAGALLPDAASGVFTGRDPAPPPARTAPWTRSAASFEQLGVARREVTGPGRQVLDIGAERPPGWKLRRDSRLELVIDAGAGLRRSSSVAASVNGVDLGIRRLEPGAERRYTFAIAGDLLDARVDASPIRSLALRLTFDLQPVQDPCTPVDTRAVRAVVQPTSRWSLPHGEHEGRDLGRFPHRLADDETGAVIVVPDDPTPAAVSGAVRLSAAMGRWAEPGALAPTIVPVSELAELERSTMNLVLLGAAAEAVLEGELPDDPPVAGAPGRERAVLTLGRSPFNARRTALVVAGDDAALELAADALSSAATVRSLQGRQVVVTEPDGPGVPTGQPLAAADGAEPPVELTPVIDDPRTTERRVTAAVVLAVFLLMIGLVVRYRWARPRRP